VSAARAEGDGHGAPGREHDTEFDRPSFDRLRVGRRPPRPRQRVARQRDASRRRPGARWRKPPVRGSQRSGRLPRDGGRSSPHPLSPGLPAAGPSAAPRRAGRSARRPPGGPAIEACPASVGHAAHPGVAGAAGV